MGIFRKWVGVLSFCKIFSKSLIGLSPICCDCSCVGPLSQFEHVLRKISLCSCSLHHLGTLLLVRCLTKCPSDIFVLNWTQVSSNAWILSWLIMFWSVFVVFTHYVQFVPQCHAMHTLSTPHASHAASQCITCCTHMHQHMLNIDTHMHSYLTHALCLCISVLSCFCSVFKFFYHCFELTWVAFALLSFLFFVLICKCLRLKA